MKCKGKRRGSGEPCGKHAMKGREYCRTHGGTKPVGAANPAFKTGLRSKYIPARLAEKYAESLNDPQLIEYAADVSMLQARLFELLQTGESLPLWQQTQDAYAKVRKAIADKDDYGLATALSTLGGLIGRGMDDALRWADIYRVTEQMGKTKEREHKRLVQSELLYSAEQLIAMVGQIIDTANTTIRDSDDRKAFQAALYKFGLLAAGGRAEDGGH